MSNLEAAQRIYDAWSRGDFSDVSWADPDIEFVGGDGETHKGVEAMGRAWSEFLALWDDFGVTTDQFIARGGTVLVLMRFQGTAKASGVPGEFLIGANRLEFRNGRVARLVLYSDRAAALDELGSSSLQGTWRLVEWTASSDAETLHPAGPDAVGRIVYSGDGYMSAFLARADGFSDALAYSGSWEMLGDGEVVHRVSLSTRRGFVGAELVRFVSWADEDLVLTTPPRDGCVNRLRWRREAP